MKINSRHAKIIMYLNRVFGMTNGGIAVMNLILYVQYGIKDNLYAGIICAALSTFCWHSYTNMRDNFVKSG